MGSVLQTTLSHCLHHLPLEEPEAIFRSPISRVRMVALQLILLICVLVSTNDAQSSSQKRDYIRRMGYTDTPACYDTYKCFKTARPDADLKLLDEVCCYTAREKQCKICKPRK